MLGELEETNRVDLQNIFEVKVKPKRHSASIEMCDKGIMAKPSISYGYAPRKVAIKYHGDSSSNTSVSSSCRQFLVLNERPSFDCSISKLNDTPCDMKRIATPKYDRTIFIMNLRRNSILEKVSKDNLIIKGSSKTIQTLNINRLIIKKFATKQKLQYIRKMCDNSEELKNKWINGGRTMCLIKDYALNNTSKRKSRLFLHGNIRIRHNHIN